MIDSISFITRDMHILQHLLSTGIYTRNFISTYPIMLDLLNIILIYSYNKVTLYFLNSFNNILKLFFIVWTRSTLFHLKLILNPIHFVIQQFSSMILSYLLLELKLVLIYWMMNILQYLMPLIKYQIHQKVINFQEKFVDHSDQLRRYHHRKIHTKFRNIILKVENIRSGSVFL